MRWSRLKPADTPGKKMADGYSEDYKLRAGSYLRLFKEVGPDVIWKYRELLRGVYLSGNKSRLTIYLAKVRGSAI